MSTDASSKINLLLQKMPSGALFFSSWMKENGISYELQRRYRDSEWLTPLGAGVMARSGENPSLYGALSSLNNQTGKHFYVGGLIGPGACQRIYTLCSDGKTELFMLPYG
jgi:hypothetical protein